MSTNTPQPPREHVSSADCWCEPVLEHTTAEGAYVWLHIEASGERPPVTVVAEAIAQASDDEDDD